jgi:alanine racemase
VCAVVKADGYGHGAVAVAQAAIAAGATWLAVALIEEALVLRRAGITAPILLLSEPPVAAAGAVLDATVTPFVYTVAFASALQDAAALRDVTVAVHLKLDTGMGRVGVTGPMLGALLTAVLGFDRLVIDGVATHLARADEDAEDAHEETSRQLAAFAAAGQTLAHAGVRPTFLHAANTAAALRYPAARQLTFPGGKTTTLLRCGIGVYGLSPSDEVDAQLFGLRPALTVRSAVSFVKHVAAGTPVSYGHRWRAPTDGWVATVPVGYADGVPRALTNRGFVLIGGRRLPIVGTVTMDQLLVFLGDEPVTVGEEVTLLGSDAYGGSIRVEEWAAAASTITYEVTSQMTARLPRRYRDDSSVQRNL